MLEQNQWFIHIFKKVIKTHAKFHCSPVQLQLVTSYNYAALAAKNRVRIVCT